MLTKVLIFFTLVCQSILALQYEECQNVEPDSFVAVENDCSGFIYCAEDDESSFKDVCPEDTYFNAEDGECQIDVDNICLVNYETQEEIETTITKLEPETTSTTFWPVTTSSTTLTTIDEHKLLLGSRPKCVRHLDSYYPHFQRCEYYFKCISGYLTILRCNFNHAWDYQKEMCVPLNMVQCYGKSRLSTKKSKTSKWIF